MAPVQSPQTSPSSHPQTRVVVTHRLAIDETNEEVQQLLDAEMGSTEECIRAIEIYGTAHVAMNHMMEMEEEALFQDVAVPIKHVVKEQPMHMQIKYVMLLLILAY